MTNAVTIRPEPAAPVQWSEEMKGAAYLLRSGLCPPAVKTAEQALFLILAGRDLGLSPVASLRGLQVIQGKVEVSADLQLGLFHRAGGKSQWEELTDKRAALKLSAPWLTAPHTSVFTMEDAKRAQLAKGNYLTFPKAMLRSRAITQGLKDVGFDATAGLYAPGEIGGEAEVEESTGEVVTVQTEETGEVPTPAQLELLSRALKRPVWTDEEREDWNVKAADAKTKEQMAVLLDAILEAGKAKVAA